MHAFECIDQNLIECQVWAKYFHMQIEQGPLFRKNVLPWYHSNAVCLIVALVMAALLGFSVVGIRVAATQPAYHWYLWVPILLAVLSGVLFLSMIIRLVKRKWLRNGV